MARAIVLTADLLFGSNVQGALTAAGHEVVLAAGEDALREALLEPPAAAPAATATAVVIVDLVNESLKRVQAVKELREEGFLDGVPLLGYYSHVEPAVRELALAEGFDQVVPRSRMAREASELVAGLAGS